MPSAKPAQPALTDLLRKLPVATAARRTLISPMRRPRALQLARTVLRAERRRKERHRVTSSPPPPHPPPPSQSSEGWLGPSPCWLAQFFRKKNSAKKSITQSRIRTHNLKHIINNNWLINTCLSQSPTISTQSTIPTFHKTESSKLFTVPDNLLKTSSALMPLPICSNASPFARFTRWQFALQPKPNPPTKQDLMFGVGYQA